MTIAELHGRRAAVGAVDARLALGALAAWVAVAVLIDRAPILVAASAGLAGVLGASALALRRRPGMPAIALGAFCIVIVTTPLAARLAHARASPLFRLARTGADVGATVELTADPAQLTATGTAGSARVIVPATVESIVVGGNRTEVAADVLVLAPADGWQRLLPGQRVSLDARLQPPLRGSDMLSAVLVARGPPRLLGRPPWWQRAAGSVRDDLRSASVGLPGDVSGLLPGLIDGDTSSLDPVIAADFRTAGLTHLVAVSGLTAQ
ncbi:MAG: hypothetical protein JO147_07615 [Actinobacteria bacterium]|nr:hypothetical protein [Actinomycetota bacterium]